MSIVRFFSLLGTVAIYALPLLVVGGGCYLWLDSALISPIDESTTEVVSFEVPKGSTLETVATKLEQEGIVNNAWAVTLLASLQSVDANLQLRAGEYEVSRSQTPKEVLSSFLQAKIIFRDFTNPVGSTVFSVAKLMADTTLTTESEAKVALQDPALLVQLRVPSSSFEGYLFPGDYKFSKPENARDMIAAMVKRNYEATRDEIPDWSKRTLEIGFTPHEVLTIASIIEAEDVSTEDKAELSSLIHNRLRIGMPLQSDTILKYAFRGENQEITDVERAENDPYNTYINVGLPPTAISNPGIESIKAALYPADTDHLYYVKNSAGELLFAPTFKKFKELQ